MINFKVDNMGRWNMDNMLYITVPIVAHKGKNSIGLQQEHTFIP